MILPLIVAFLCFDSGHYILGILSLLCSGYRVMYIALYIGYILGFADKHNGYVFNGGFREMYSIERVEEHGDEGEEGAKGTNGRREGSEGTVEGGEVPGVG